MVAICRTEAGFIVFSDRLMEGLHGRGVSRRSDHGCVITHPLTRTCLRCRISSLRQYRAAVALKVIVGEIPVMRSVARPFWSPLLERYWSEAELLSNGLGSTV